jgi:hypothetical protein
LFRNGKDILAEYEIPRWLHDLTGGKPLPTSSEWDIATKRPGAAALVLNGAVADAVMMAAFARHDTTQGQYAMQQMHDQAASCGAVCSADNVAKMASRHEATGIQKIHDMAVEHGAKCSSTSSRSPYMFSLGGNSHMSAAEKFNKFMDRFKAANPTAEVPVFEDKDFVAPASAGDTARFAQLEKDNKALMARFAAQEAELFVANLIEEGKAAPYERGSLIAQFSQAASDDAAIGGTAKFSAFDATAGKLVDAEGTRVEQLKATLALRPSSGLTRELIANGRTLTEADAKVLFSKPNEKETPEDKQKRIDAQTEIERKAHGLAAKK